MGTGKKEANRKIKQGKVGDGMANVKTKGENFYRYFQPTVGEAIATSTNHNFSVEMRRKSRP